MGGAAAKNSHAVPGRIALPGTPITVEDVLNSRMIAYPFRLLQCCLVTDGGGALILVSAERAGDFPQSLPLAANRGPAYLMGTSESVETPDISQMGDFTSASGAYFQGRPATRALR